MAARTWSSEWLVKCWTHQLEVQLHPVSTVIYFEGHFSEIGIAGVVSYSGKNRVLLESLYNVGWLHRNKIKEKNRKMKMALRCCWTEGGRYMPFLSHCFLLIQMCSIQNIYCYPSDAGECFPQVVMLPESTQTYTVGLTRALLDTSWHLLRKIVTLKKLGPTNWWTFAGLLLMHGWLRSSRHWIEFCYTVIWCHFDWQLVR